MLDIFAIVAIALMFALVGFLTYMVTHAGQRAVTQPATTVPGLKPSDPVRGNLDEIADAGSFHKFLATLHGEYGDIASFYLTDQVCVSIASSQLFKEHREPFDRPPILFELYKPIFGSDSIAYANGDDWKKRRELTDRCFGYQALHNYVAIFNEITEELIQKLLSLPPNEHVPLHATGLDLALKGVVRTSLGDYFKDDKSVANFRKDYDFVWSDMDSRLAGSMPEPGGSREKAFEEGRGRILQTIREAVKFRRSQQTPGQGSENFIDVLLKARYPEAKLHDDLIGYVIGGFHTSGNLFAWALFYLTQNEDVQERLFDHVVEVAGRKGEITIAHISEMKYMRQVIDETLRASALAPYAARFNDHDVTLGGHVIPAGTPVVHALGVSLQSEKYYPNHKVFDPERFSAENVKGRPREAFQPFGFAGRRVCPGYQFAYKEIAVYLASFVRAFKVQLVPGQETEPVHGFVTHLANKDGGDVWITLEKR